MNNAEQVNLLLNSLKDSPLWPRFTTEQQRDIKDYCRDPDGWWQRNPLDEVTVADLKQCHWTKEPS